MNALNAHEVGSVKHPRRYARALQLAALQLAALQLAALQLAALQLAARSLAILTFLALAHTAFAQAPAAPAKSRGQAPPAAAPSTQGAPPSSPHAAPPGAAPGAGAAAPARPRPPGGNKMQSPHGLRTQVARVVPAPDLERGGIGVLLTTSDFQNVALIGGQEIRLMVSKQSIERGNVESVLVQTTDERGRVYFPAQPTETDHVYRVSATFEGATFSSSEFQFKNTTGGLRVIIPVFTPTDSLDGLLLLSRTVVALTPQDDLFVVNLIWRVENYSEKAWTPKDLGLALPPGFRALTIQSSGTDGRFEPDGEKGVKFAGTFVPGQHDLTFRFHWPTEGKSERQFYIATPAHLGSMRVIVDGSPDMKLDVESFPPPEVTRNQEGQRRLVVTRDFLKEAKKPPDLVRVSIAGIPTPPGGKYISVGAAAVIALAGLGQNWMGRRRSARAASNLSKEDRDRASELLLEEMISLERAFEQGAIGRKMHEQAKRQLLEAYARLGLGQEEQTAA